MNRLGVFAKYWQPGQVKTRLSATIGDESASELYRQFVCILLERFGAIGDDRVIVYWPETNRGDFSDLAGASWQLAPQTAGDLGQKIEQFFEDSFAKSAHQVVVVGTDSPTLPKQFIDQAFQTLTTVDVVLGPTTDGGYYLVGAAHRVPPIFDRIEWSTNRVWSQTVERLNCSGLTWGQLPTWYDIDEADDLIRLRKELSTTFAKERVFEPLRNAVCEINRANDVREDG